MPALFKLINGELCAEGIDQLLQDIRKKPRDKPLERGNSQLCLGNIMTDNPTPLHRDFFRYLGERDLSYKEHVAHIVLCCVRKFKIRSEDLEICQHALKSLRVTKGDVVEIDLPSLENCVKMTEFAMIKGVVEKTQHEIDWSNKVKFTSGLPEMPFTLTTLLLGSVEDSDECPCDLARALCNVRGLQKLHLLRMEFRQPLDFVFCFRTLITLSVKEVEGLIPTPAFWAKCRDLKTVNVSGCPANRSAHLATTKFFDARTKHFSPSLQTIELHQLVIPELPECICECVHLTSLTVTDCGLVRLPQSLCQMESIENLSVGANDLTLEGISVLALCDFFLTPPPEESPRWMRCLSLGGNKLLPAGIPLSVEVIEFLREQLPPPPIGTDRHSSGQLREFPYTSLQEATDDFHASKILSAEGTFGSVYRAQLGERYTVAVKVMRESSTVKGEMLQAELSTLQQCRHPHLLQLLGHSIDGPAPCIVYEHKHHGSLRRLLDEETVLLTTAPADTDVPRPLLHWRRRLCILMQVSLALEYLHTVAQPPIIHRDIKTNNILLDATMSASIGDFGLARVCPELDATSTHASTRIFGTPGYIDPSYAQTGKVTLASDLYSFGIVCLELLTGRRAYDSTLEPSVLATAFEEAVEDGELASFLMPAGQPPGHAWKPEAAKAVVSLCKQCLRGRSTRRPSIQDVASTLTALCDQWVCRTEHLAAGLSNDESDVCVVCMEELCTHAALPCGHKCLCGSHMDDLMGRPCPMCRTPIESIERIYS